MLAPHSSAQSGRRTQQPVSTNPSSTQRPRRATEAQQPKKSTATKSTATTQPTTQTTQSTQQPTQKSAPVVSILPDDAPPIVKPKPPPPPKTTTVEEEVDPGEVVRITSNLVTVPASVVDPLGRAVTGLRLEDFELRVDGQVRSISDISYSDTPVRLALLFDNSSSLTVARDFEKQAAIRFFRSVLRPVDQAAVYNVYTEVELVQPLTSDVRALSRTIENFGKPEGATRLFDAIVQAATYLRPFPGRKVIVVVSDGEDTLSDTNFDDTLRRVQAADCQIYAVNTKQVEYLMQTGQPMGNANLRSLAAERRLQEFAAQTGGAVYSPLTTSDLDVAFAQISADLAQQYVLSYYPSDETLDGRYRAISLRVLSHPNARVRARKGYYASRAAIRSGINWQTDETVAGASGVANLDPSDTVPKEVSIKQDGAPLSSNMTSVAPASELKVNSSVPAASAPTQSQAASTVAPRTPGPTDEPRSTQVTQPTAKQAQVQPQPQLQPQPAAQPSQASAGQPVKATVTEEKPISGGVLNGKALSLPKPDYPAAARSAGASGTVVIEVTVDETGKVIAARAVSGHPRLKPAALAAARLARFAPTKLSGQPVKVTGIINYNFVVR